MTTIAKTKPKPKIFKSFKEAMKWLKDKDNVKLKDAICKNMFVIKEKENL